MSEISGGGSNEGTSSGAEVGNSAEVSASVEIGGAAEMNGTNEVSTSSDPNGAIEIGLAKETSGSEIAISPEQTSHGMNQMFLSCNDVSSGLRRKSIHIDIEGKCKGEGKNEK